MKNGPYESEGARRHFAYSKVDVMKLDTKCLFAGKLERIRDWEEKPHSHAFCEIMLVEAGAGEVVVDGVKYPIKKGDIVIYNPDAVHGERTGDEGLAVAFFGIRNFNVESLPSDHLIAEINISGIRDVSEQRNAPKRTNSYLFTHHYKN